MIGVIVSIRSEGELDRDRAQAVADRAGSVFEGMPGLRSKVFTWDAQDSVVTNVYVWDDEAAARAFFTPELTDQIVELYGARPQVRFVEISALIDNAAVAAAAG